MRLRGAQVGRRGPLGPPSASKRPHNIHVTPRRLGPQGLAATGSAVAVAPTHSARGFERSLPAANEAAGQPGQSTPTGCRPAATAERRPAGSRGPALLGPLWQEPVRASLGARSRRSEVAVVERAHQWFRRAFLRRLQAEAAATLGRRKSRSRRGRPASTGRFGGGPAVPPLPAHHGRHAGPPATGLPRARPLGHLCDDALVAQQQGCRATQAHAGMGC